MAKLKRLSVGCTVSVETTPFFYGESALESIFLWTLYLKRNLLAYLVLGPLFRNLICHIHTYRRVEVTPRQTSVLRYGAIIIYMCHVDTCIGECYRKCNQNGKISILHYGLRLPTSLCSCQVKVRAGALNFNTSMVFNRPSVNWQYSIKFQIGL